VVFFHIKAGGTYCHHCALKV